jgi:hypothetical protein
MDFVGKSTGKYGGSIRESGGTLADLEAASEELYFKEQDRKKIEELREKMRIEETQKNTKSSPNDAS